LLEDFLQQHENDGLDAGSGDDEQEKDFLGNTDLSLTQKYLQKRSRMQENNKKKAEIETKATKNRKIRYIVHDKILNFL